MGLRRLRGGDAGAVAVEMALVFPLLALLAMGVIDVGRIVYTNVSVQDAAQEGALFAAYEPDNPAVVRERVQESIGAEGAAASALSVVVSCPASGEIRLSVARSLDLLTPFMSTFIGDTVQLDRTITAPIVSEDACVAG